MREDKSISNAHGTRATETAETIVMEIVYYFYNFIKTCLKNYLEMTNFRKLNLNKIDSRKSEKPERS